MNHIRQPRNVEELNQAVESAALRHTIIQMGEGKLFLCGQCCVAMVANQTLQEAVIACGQTGATRTADIMGALAIFGIESLWSLWVMDKSVPQLCIIRTVRGPDSSHWVVRNGDLLYDPIRDEPITFFARDLRHPRAVITILDG